MALKQLLKTGFPATIDLVWVLPTVILIILAEVTFHSSFAVPVPFLLIIVGVGRAGAYGGKRAGLVAGVSAAFFIGHAYLARIIHQVECVSPFRIGSPGVTGCRRC